MVFEAILDRFVDLCFLIIEQHFFLEVLYDLLNLLIRSVFLLLYLLSESVFMLLLNGLKLIKILRNLARILCDLVYLLRKRCFGSVQVSVCDKTLNPFLKSSYRRV